MAMPLIMAFRPANAYPMRGSGDCACFMDILISRTSWQFCHKHASTTALAKDFRRRWMPSFLSRFSCMTAGIRRLTRRTVSGLTRYCCVQFTGCRQHLHSFLIGDDSDEQIGMNQDVVANFHVWLGQRVALELQPVELHQCHSARHRYDLAG